MSKFSKASDCETTNSHDSSSSLGELGHLPRRPKGGCNEFRQVQLLTNYYKVNFQKNHTIYIFAYQFTPRMSEDNRQLRNAIMKGAFQRLKETLGGLPIISGKTIYSCSKPPFEKETILTVRHENVDYRIEVKLVRTLKMSDINLSDSKQAFLPLSFLNSLLKMQMRMIGYAEIGRSKKYFDNTTRREIPNTNLFLYNGFSTSFQLLEGGLYLRVDPVNKIVQSECVLKFINELYAQYSTASKDDKRSIVVESMVGKCVMSNYGTNRYWKIEGVMFDTNVDEIIVNKDTNQTLAEYYNSKYNLTIKNKKQPLLKARTRDRLRKQDKEEEMALLVPELLLLTGIPENFEERLRRNVSDMTIRPPEEKLAKIKDLMLALNRDTGDLSLKQVKDCLQIEIEPELSRAQAHIMQEPKLLLGAGNAVEQGRASSFQLFNKPLFDCSTDIKMLMVYFDSYDSRSLINIFTSTANNMKLRMRIKEYNMGRYTSNKGLSDIEDLLRDEKEEIKVNFNIVFLILPAVLKAQYKKVKRYALNSSSRVITQVALETTLGKKGFNSIATKLLIQVATKTGNVPWLPEPPKSINSRLMIVGIDSAPDKQSKGQSVVGFCATLDKSYSKFYSKVSYQPKSTVVVQGIRELIAGALKDYELHNKWLPDEILVLRDGCTEAQIELIQHTEITDLLEGLSIMYKKNLPSTIYVVVDRKVSQKFFTCNNNRIANPQFGTLINSGVVSRNYDFFMVAQNCNKGTATPTYYKVLHNNSRLNEGQLSELIYGQCFNYMNWSGSVRVPSVCQYSRKLCTFVAENLKEFKDEDLRVNERLYFI